MAAKTVAESHVAFHFPVARAEGIERSLVSHTSYTHKSKVGWPTHFDLKALPPLMGVAFVNANE